MPSKEYCENRSRYYETCPQCGHPEYCPILGWRGRSAVRSLTNPARRDTSKLIGYIEEGQSNASDVGFYRVKLIYGFFIGAFVALFIMAILALFLHLG